MLEESHHSHSRSREDKPTYLGVGPDLDVERSSQGGRAYNSVGVKKNAKETAGGRPHESICSLAAIILLPKDFNLVSVAEDAEFGYSPCLLSFCSLNTPFFRLPVVSIYVAASGRPSLNCMPSVFILPFHL
ncbi:hypothetical protein M9H77_08253 [Catharanthus roseus]|uniref:Uncharacterized protein n=1 Tax=Catharanthus roseus TaxID=4058 RepID=A0ACC0BX96_CATRO|nr:hypothetical protein M9H77_08253 [Catharanthus roseus]